MNTKSITLLILSFTLFSGCTHYDLISSLNTSDDVFNFNDDKAEKFLDNCYYYYSDEKIIMSRNNDVLYVQFDNALIKKQVLADLYDQFSFQEFSLDNYTIDHESRVILKLNNCYSEEMIEKLNAYSGINTLSYVTEYQGIITAASDHFFVKLKQGISFSKLDELALKSSCVIRTKRDKDRLYAIYLPPSEKHKSIEYSTFFYQSGYFEYCSPSFIYLSDIKDSNDPNYIYQWSLSNRSVNGEELPGINVEPAWEITKGSNDIIVAVIDNGVEMLHEDLSSQIIPGYDAQYMRVGGNPILSSDYHGTTVAGIIAATQNNNIGISGVAPNCKILPIRIDTNFLFSDEMCCDAIDWAWENGADVINCSWSDTMPLNLTNDAIFRATSNGRNGKGCVVVFSTGNNNSNVNYPAVLDDVIAVGALDRNRMRRSTSNYGSTIDVVAPGDNILTTDIMGPYGNNSYTTANPDFLDNNYTHFSNTSAAAPHVSGIAALILSKYPNLDESQVRRAIELSCTRVTGYSYQTDNKYPPSVWNNEVGYGLVNAYQALLRAAQFDQINEQDEVPGFDFIITNNSSYTIDNLYVGLSGNINNVYCNLISHDLGGVEAGRVIGYPVYRGENISFASGLPIVDIELEFWAESLDYYGNIRIGVAIDDDTPSDYYNYSLDNDNSSYFSLPNTTVPDSCRRTLYINIINPLN